MRWIYWIPHIPNTSKQHKEDPNMQTDRAEWRQRGWRVIYLSARTAIYSTWLLLQPRGLTTTPARVKPSAEWHGVVPTSGGACLHQMTPELKGRGFRRRRGQMTCMPLGSSKGGRLFKKRLWAGWGVCVFVCERRRLSSTQLSRGPLTPILAYVCIAPHRQRRAVTLADRQPHSFRPPSALHQSVLLFNNSPDTCRITLDLRIHMLFLWPETVHSTFVTTQHLETRELQLYLHATSILGGPQLIYELSSYLLHIVI